MEVAAAEASSFLVEPTPVIPSLDQLHEVTHAEPQFHILLLQIVTQLQALQAGFDRFAYGRCDSGVGHQYNLEDRIIALTQHLETTADVQRQMIDRVVTMQEEQSRQLTEINGAGCRNTTTRLYQDENHKLRQQVGNLLHNVSESEQGLWRTKKDIVSCREISEKQMEDLNQCQVRVLELEVDKFNCSSQLEDGMRENKDLSQLVDQLNKTALLRSEASKAELTRFTESLTKSKSKEDALIKAAISGDAALTRLLLAVGANASVDNDDFFRYKPLHWAAYKGHIPVAKALLEGGTDLEVRDKYNRTPLHSAVVNGHSDMVRLLLDAGAAIDQRSIYRWTPLHKAASNGHLDVVKLLIQRGADPAARNSDGKTPRDEAYIHNQREVGNWLGTLERRKPLKLP